MIFTNLTWCMPFILCLLSISFMPLLFKEFWHKYSFATLLTFAIITLVSILVVFSFHDFVHTIVHVLFNDYIPFIVLLLALFVVSSGIYIDFPEAKGPLFNAVFIFIVSHFSGWMGTTGATILFIRPFLRINAHRKNKIHLILFFLFLVSNIGGAVSPLGDPPLFIGYLKGIDFFWFFNHLYKYVFCITLFLCTLLFVIDAYLWKKEGLDSADMFKVNLKFNLVGVKNIGLIFAILASVILCSFKGTFNLFGVEVETASTIRNIIFLAITFISLKFTDDKVRKKNDFTFGPIQEVAEVFIAIFITVVPILNMLAQTKNCPLDFVFKFVAPNGEFVVNKCFWISGLMSSILDNAPTFLIFFHLIDGNAQVMMTQKAHLLTAISLSTVFMGSLTYIGNAPNFMVKSIATENGVNMPSFLRYMMFSFLILIPIFYLLTLFL